MATDTAHNRKESILSTRNDQTERIEARPSLLTRVRNIPTRVWSWWEDLFPGSDDTPKLTAGVLVGIVGFVLVIALIASGLSGGGSSQEVLAQGSDGGPPPQECPKKWRQVDHEEVDNDLHRIFVDGLRGATDQQVNQLKKRMRTDARVLSLMESAFVDPDAVDWQALVENNCLNQHGRDLFNQVVGVMSASRASQGQAPANGINSGMTSEGPVVASSTGITGDRTSLKFVLPSGKVVHILVRCGNAVFEEKPPIPEGPTDEPPTTTTTTTTTTVPSTTTTTTTVPPTPKCFDEDGNPIFDGEFCGTEDSGPDQQPVQENDPDLVGQTSGYEPGSAEQNAQEQSEACSGSGCGFESSSSGTEVQDSQQGGKAPAGSVDEPSGKSSNSDFESGTRTTNPDDGTSNFKDSNAQPEDSGEDTTSDSDGSGSGDADNNSGDPLGDTNFPS